MAESIVPMKSIILFSVALILKIPRFLDLVIGAIYILVIIGETVPEHLLMLCIGVIFALHDYIQQHENFFLFPYHKMKYTTTVFASCWMFQTQQSAKAFYHAGPFAWNHWTQEFDAMELEAPLKPSY